MLLYSKNVYIYTVLLVFMIHFQEMVNGGRIFGTHRLQLRNEQNEEEREEPRIVRKALRTAIGFGKRDSLTMEKIRKKMPMASRELSTAINYGKRDSRNKLRETESLLQKLTQRESVPVEWFEDVLENNPALLQMIVYKIITARANEDEEICSDERVRSVPGYNFPYAEQ